MAAALATCVLAAPAQADAPTPLRVCADPDNLPYSRDDGRGFEIGVAHILADTLQRPLQIVWQPLRRGFVRKTLGEGRCELLMGVPVGLARVLTTRAYYRSGFVLVQRADAAPPLAGFDDPRLARLRIGVQLIGDDLAASPPGHALARHGAVQRVVGYTVDGGDAPAGARMVQALARRELDAALVWGPQVGWFVARAPAPMVLRLLAPPADATMPFQYSIALAVRPGDHALRDALQAALDARRADIDAVLRAYAVPRTDTPGGGAP